MLSEMTWILVGVISLWVVLSIARRISSDHRGAPEHTAIRFDQSSHTKQNDS
jgi:hypothetical protein